MRFRILWLLFVSSVFIMPMCLHAQKPVVYKSFNGPYLHLFAWQGEKVTILSRDSTLHTTTMNKWVTVMDKVYAYYRTCTGREPAINPAAYINGRATIADVPATCGAGCGYLGTTGIELKNQYFDNTYNAINTANEYSQEVFYEFGRNFWFYGAQLAYKNNDPVTTGYAVFMRFMAMEASEVNGAPFRHLPFNVFEQNVEELVDKYIADTTLNWQNTLGTNRGIPLSTLGATDLFASFCFRLRRDYGGQAFVENIWKNAAKRPVARTTADAVDNFFLSCCLTTNKNLTTLFHSWKFPLSQTAIAEAGKFPL